MGLGDGRVTRMADRTGLCTADEQPSDELDSVRPLALC